MGELTFNGHEISGTTTNRDANVEEGQMFFNETLGQQQFFDGTNWLTVLTSNSSGVFTAMTINAIVAGDSNLNITGLAGTGTGNGGVITMAGGAGADGTTGNGAALNLLGGLARSDNGDGGSVGITGGNATGTGAAGSIVIAGGNSDGASGTGGSVTLAAGEASGGTAGDINLILEAGGQIVTTNLPTSDPSVSGALYSDSGTIKISA